jgi:extradiol dioxygenase family protein
MNPIFHLSFPVRDMDEAVRFYRDEMGAGVGRQADSFTDILLFGAQITLQNDPGNVLTPMPRTRHFGATLGWSAWEGLAERFAASPHMVEPATISYRGEPIEQGKLMLRDPSGNLIEIKAYRHPERVLGALAVS